MIQFQFIPAGSFRPDVAPFESGFADSIQNVYPRSIVGNRVTFGPTQAFSPFVGALPKRCQGAFTFRSSNGQSYIAAGTEDELYLLQAGLSAYQLISSAQAFISDTEDMWDFAQYGDIVFATNFQNPLNYFELGISAQNVQTATVASVATVSGKTPPPQAKFISTVREWLVLANTYDPIDGIRNQRIRWSAIGDPFNWPDPIVSGNQAAQLQSDYQDIPGDQGQITGLVPNLANADAAVFFERGIYRMLFGQYPYTFTFDAVEGARGTPAPKSLVPVGNQVYYFGSDGFYVFDGIQSVPIGTGKINEWFIKTVSKKYFTRIVGVADPEKQTIYWSFPSVDSTIGLCDYILIHNYSLGEWAVQREDTTYLLISETFPVTLEQLDLFYPGGLENMPFSLDSSIFIGDIKRITAFNHQNEMGYLGAENKPATIESGQFSQPGEIRGLLNTVRVIHNAQDPNFSVQVGWRDNMFERWKWSAHYHPQDSGFISVRKDSRYFKIRMNIDAGSNWDHFQGFEVAFGTGRSGR